MTDTTKTKKHTIDATGKTIGRVASEVAHLLLGKDDPAYTPHKVADVEVVVTNASALNITSKKKDEKQYTRHSGWPGGLRHTSLGEVIEEKGYGEVLRRAVYGMLPDNKLRTEMMKRLDIKE